MGWSEGERRERLREVNRWQRKEGGEKQMRGGKGRGKGERKRVERQWRGDWGK